MKIDGYQMNQSAYSSSLMAQSIKYSVETEKVNEFVTVEQVPLSPDQSGVQWAEDYSVPSQDKLEEADHYMTDEDQRKIKLLEAFISYVTGKPFSFQKVMRLNPYRHKEDDPIQKSKRVKKDTELMRALPLEAKRHPFKKHSQIMIQRNLTKVDAEVASYEREQYDFKSKGQVTTEDGRQIDIEYDLSMSREAYNKASVHYETMDPLTFSFDGTGIKASKFKIEIDLDLDGQKESITAPGDNAGFLALDKNENGTIDDGSELFGAQTGRGFDELRAYDQDQNGWIDENDTVFKSLKIWSFDDEGNQTLTGLLDADVGAIYLGEVSGKYHLQADDSTFAEIKASSIYLKESGGVGSVHQLDFVV